MNHTDKLGRIAQLCNLVSKPELNGAYVVVESYHHDSDRYVIKTLPIPNIGTKTVSLLVKLSSIRFPMDRSFTSVYPSALVQSGGYFDNQYLPGTVLDYTNVTGKVATPALPADAMFFGSSCRVVGAMGPGGSPATQFSEACTVVELRHSDSFIEFQNIDFTDDDVFVAHGENISFRNCRFGGSVGLTCGYIERRAVVTAESCLFDGNIECGILLIPGSQVSLLNCTLRNCSIGMLLDRGVCPVCTHCEFTNCAVGIDSGYMGIDNSGSKLELVNCSFLQNEKAVGAAEGAHLGIQGCLFQYCRHAVAMVGPKRVHVSIEDSAIVDCAMGLTAAMGKVELSTTDTQIEKNTFGSVFGALFAINLLDSVSLSNCPTKERRTS